MLRMNIFLSYPEFSIHTLESSFSLEEQCFSISCFTFSHKVTSQQTYAKVMSKYTKVMYHLKIYFNKSINANITPRPTSEISLFHERWSPQINIIQKHFISLLVLFIGVQMSFLMKV